MAAAGRALTAAGGDRDRAARLLGISRATLYRELRALPAVAIR
jgi:transcriptional regulator of acetoin/glycerol metabolism